MIKSLTESLADQLVSWRAQEFPIETFDAARFYLIDWLGSTLAGHATEPGRMMLDYAEALPDGDCSIVGGDRSLSADGAALVNGALSHIVEMDDLERRSVVHPAAVVIPAALAVAQREHRTGEEFLTAIVAGYEVAIRIGEAVGKEHYYYFHNTATCGVFGAAAAAGWLLGLNAKQFVWAFGNAGTQAAGLWQFNADGDMSKHLHAGRAASSGVLAADLAKCGFTGARQILEGERGFFAAMAPEAVPERVLEGLNIDDPTKHLPKFKISGVSIKPHASCRHTHPAVDAALALRRQLNGHRIIQVKLETYQAALDLCDNPDPQTPYAAKFSLHYCVAAALLRGQVGLTDFTATIIHDPEIRELLPLIQAKVTPEFEQAYPAEWPVRLHVQLENDTIIRHEVRHPKGDPTNQLTMDELEAKFRTLAIYGGHDAEVGAWLGWVLTLEDGPL